MKFLLFIFFISLFYSRLIFAQQVLWQHLGLDNLEVLSIEIDHEGNLFVGTADSGIFKSTDSGSQWIHLSLPLYRIDALVVGKDSSILAGGNNGLFKSSDGGLIWRRLNLPEYSQISTVYVNPSGEIFASILNFNDTTGGLIFQSLDNGKSWINITNGLTNTLILGFCSLPDGQTLAGSYTGDIYIDKPPPNEWFFYGGIYKSVSKDSQWFFLGLDSIDIKSIIPLSNNNILLGSYWNGVFLSTDEGATWNESNSGLTNFYQKNIRSILLLPNNKIYLATLGGVFVSIDYGTNWISYNNGLGDTNALSIAVDSSGFLYAGTRNGIFRSIKSTTRMNDEENVLPKFSLFQNYPNPFNPSTTICFALPYQSSVELIIYDVMGREIKSFNNISQNAGTHNIFWDGMNNSGENVSSGIYLYRIRLKSLESNEIFEKTAKLMLMK